MFADHQFIDYLYRELNIYYGELNVTALLKESGEIYTCGHTCCFFLFPSFCLGVLIRIYTSVYITVAAVGFVGVKCLSVYQKMLVCLFL